MFVAQKSPETLLLSPVGTAYVTTIGNETVTTRHVAPTGLKDGLRMVCWATNMPLLRSLKTMCTMRSVLQTCRSYGTFKEHFDLLIVFQGHPFAD